MPGKPHPGLLPAGLRDLLPSDAAHEAAVVERLVQTLTRNGYERVKPPLLEFEDSLLSDAGAALAPDMFRLMDPVSQRMIALRADMTLQVARIAATRLARAPRPLRLSYAGQVLRVRGTQVRPERQVGQVGAELVGSEAPGADAEAIVLAAEAVQEAGVERLSVDITIPTLVPRIAEAFGLTGEARGAVRAALDRKDPDALAAAAGPATGTLAALLDAGGPVRTALAKIAAIDLPDAARADWESLTEVVGRVLAAAPDLVLTVDPVENRGFEYHTGISFTLFGRGVRGEIGRGGRYRLGFGRDEPATGFTLYMDTLLRALRAPGPGRRLYLAAEVTRAAAKARQDEGWITVAGLAPVGDPAGEARRLGCGHWQGADGAVIPV